MAVGTLAKRGKRKRSSSHRPRRRRRGTRGLSGLDFGAKVKRATTAEQGAHMLQAIAGAAPYLLIPTWLNLDGPMALVVGAGSTWLLGTMLDWPGMRMAAAVGPMIHIAYGHLQEPAKAITGNKFFWRLNPGAPIAGTNTVPATDTSTINGLRGRMGYYPQQLNAAMLPGNVTDPGYQQNLGAYANNIPVNFAAQIANNRMRLPVANVGGGMMAG